MKPRKSWHEKMENSKLPKLVPVPPPMRPRFGDGVMLVPSPRQVEAAIRGIRKGSLATLSQLRQTLARKYAANVTCPLCTGIFWRISAELAEEEAAAGKKKITPYWRVVRDDGSLNEKLPGGVARQEQHLRDEGHRLVAASGKRPPRVVLAQSAGR